MKKIPYSTQFIDQEDIKAVINTLNSKNLTKGQQIKKFELLIKKKIKCKHAIGVINASSALILACRAVGIKKNDIVWTSPITYIATANAALHCGAKIDLVDINLDDYNISTELLEKKLIIAKKKNNLPKLLIVVHLAGYPSDMKKISELSEKYKFKIIEDASHAFGARYKNQLIGNCKFSDITIFSFHPVKIVTTAEGGILTTNIKKYSDKIIQLRENGYSKIKHNDPNYYDIVDLGYNFRLNEINSSLGISQIKKLNWIQKEKKKIVNFYFKNLNHEDLILPKYETHSISSWHLFILRFTNKILKKVSKIEIINKLRKKGIYVNTHYIPLQYFKYIKLQKKFNNLKNSIEYYNSAISIPLFPHLDNKTQKYIVNTIKKIIS